MADDVIDRERIELGRQARALQLQEYWIAQPDFQSTEPRRAATPYLWRWRDVGPLLDKSSEVIGVGANSAEAERRALVLSNPGLGGKPDITTTLYADLQLVKPGETAPAHRHTTTASRFILRGGGGFTTVQGEKCRMERGDLIINPPWLWHDFGNEGGEDAIWLDVLDVPLVNALNAVFYDYDFWKEEDVDKNIQTVRKPTDYSARLFATGGMRPKFVPLPTTPYSRQLVYRWEDVRTRLHRLRDYGGSAHDGIILEYADPETGSSLGPTMDFSIQLLRGGERTQAHRHTSSTVYCVAEGRGYTEIDRQRLEWHENDVFVVPSWLWHHHASAGGEAVLYSVSDRPAVARLGLYREEVRTETGDIAPVTV
jgi:gentisate 1,2-dioxygenase